MGTSVPQDEQEEIHRLGLQAHRLNWYLLALTLLSLAATVMVAMYAGWSTPYSAGIGMGICVAAGTMGSAVAALQSSQERRANGWEVASGKKYPEAKPDDKFNAGMVPRFYTRPFLGSVVGAVFYLGASSVFGFVTWGQEDLGKLAFWSFVVGIMAKTFIETLKDLFKKLGK